MSTTQHHLPTRPWQSSNDPSAAQLPVPGSQQQLNPWTVIQQMYTMVQAQLKQVEAAYHQVHPIVYAQSLEQHDQAIRQDCDVEAQVVGMVKPNAWIVMLNRRELKSNQEGTKDIWAMIQYLPDPEKPIVKTGWILLKHHQDYHFGNFSLYPGGDHERKLYRQSKSESPSWCIWLYDKIFSCMRKKQTSSKKSSSIANPPNSPPMHVH